MGTAKCISSTSPPHFDGSDYRYWKTRMRAHLKSRGAGVWEITQDETYAIPFVRTSQDDKDKYYTNNKAVDILLASLCRAKFDRVEDLVLASEIWSTLQNFHKGTNQVKLVFSSHIAVSTRTSHICPARPLMPFSSAFLQL